MPAFVWFLALIRFCHFIDFMVLTPLGPEITRSLGISEAKFNLLAAAYPLAAGVSCFLFIPWIDYFEKNAYCSFVSRVSPSPHFSAVTPNTLKL